MNLVDQVKNHQIIVMATVALGLAGSAVALVIKIENTDKEAIKSRYESQIAKLSQSNAESIAYYKRLLASTQIVVGKDASAVDVSRIPVSSDEVSQLPNDDRYIQEGDFYALQSPASGWKYTITSEPQLISDITGASLASVRQSYRQLGLGGLVKEKVYLWRRPTPRRLSALGANLTLYPQLAVERVRLEPIVRAAQAQVTERGADAREARATIGSFYRTDPAGALILGALLADIQSTGPLGSASAIESVQKKGTAVYARINSTFTNVIVDGRRYPHFNYAREFVIIGAGEDVFFIKTFLPSEDPRSPDLAFVRAWFKLFHFRFGP